MKPNSNSLHIGMWNSSISADVKKVDSFNRQPIEVTKDQLKHLYLLVYPFVASEFVHRDDLYDWSVSIKNEFQKMVDKFNTDLSAVLNILSTHTHLSAAPSTPTGPPVPTINPVPQLSLWSSNTEDNNFKNGENLIIKEQTSIPSLQQRSKSSNKNIINSSDEIATSAQIDDGQYLKPFDVDDNEINEPNTFS